jgi:hypothetical protein
MARRMFDTNELSSPYIRGLKGANKLLYLYLKRVCDHAGICWNIELDIAGLRCGFEYEQSACITALGDGVVVFGDGQHWFIPEFLFEQYGKELNPKNKVHESAIDLLQKNFLLEIYFKRGGAIKGLTSPLQGDKDKYTTKDKDIVVGKGGMGEKPKAFENMSLHTSGNGPPLADVEMFFCGAGSDVVAAKKFWENYESVEWKKGITPIVNWRPLANMWISSDNNNKSFNNGRSGSATNRKDFTGNVSANGTGSIHE